MSRRRGNRARAPRNAAPPRRSYAQRVRYGPLGPRVVTLHNDRSPVALGRSGEGYHSAQRLVDAGLATALGGSADLHLRYHAADLRAQSQLFMRENGIYQGVIKRPIDVMLGEGLKLQAKTDDEDTNKRLEELWTEWWANPQARPEVRGLDDGPALERLMLQHLFVDGDFGIIPDRNTGLIQFVESERIYSTRTKSDSGRRIEDGVELSRLGKPLAFWVSDYSDYGNVQTNSVRKPADNFIYLANRDRMSQTRGTPVHQCNFGMFHRIQDVCDSEAAAWQLLSRLALAIIRKDGPGIALKTSQEYSSPTDAQLAKRYHDIGDAIMVHIEPGEDVKGIERNIPGANFVESIKLYLRLLGMPMGFSLEFMLLLWSDTNYSSGRASIQQVERSCRPWLRMLKWQGMAPIYNWRVRRWAAAGKVKAIPSLYRHTWHAQPYPPIDEDKREKARTARLRNGSTSPIREALRDGEEFLDLLAEQKSAYEAILEVVRELNERYPGANLTVSDFTAQAAPRKVETRGRPRDDQADEPEDVPDEEDQQ